MDTGEMRANTAWCVLKSHPFDFAQGRLCSLVKVQSW